MRKSRVVNATEFKAKCLALLDAVEEGESITVTRRGKPVAIVSPVKRKAFKNPANSWAGRMEIVGDIVTSDPEMWDVVNGREIP